MIAYRIVLSALVLMSILMPISAKRTSSAASSKAKTEHRLYDFVVPRDGTFRDAIKAANERKDVHLRFRIFIQKGHHLVPTEGTTTGGDNQTYPDPRVWLTSPNVCIIGEDRDSTIVENITPPATWNNGFNAASPLEGIGNGDVLILQKTAEGTYLSNFTLRNGMADRTGRNIALHDRSTHTICDNMCLWAYQDTYVSNQQQGMYYFKGGVIRGRTDYVCGKGDVFFDQVTFQQCATAGYIVAPSQPRHYGYVMSQCYIHSETPDVTYYLGRPWGNATPTASWVSTKVDTPPITRDKKGYNAWADMGSKGWPARFAEYNTTLLDGTPVSLEGRRNSYTDTEGITHTYNPVLSAEEAAQLTRDNVLAGWQPWTECELDQPLPKVKYRRGKLTWKARPSALLYAICLDGKVIDFTLSTTYVPHTHASPNRWSIRVANQTGALSAPTTPLRVKNEE